MSFEKHMKCQLVASCTVGQALGRDDIFWAVVFMKVVERSVGGSFGGALLGRPYSVIQLDTATTRPVWNICRHSESLHYTVWLLQGLHII